MKNLAALVLVMGCCLATAHAQNPYLVKTKTVQNENQENSGDATENFIQLNFPRYHMKDWTPGMRFMVLPNNELDRFKPVFTDAETNKTIGNSSLQYQILEYQGCEMDEAHKNVRFNFYCEETGKNYYHKVTPVTLTFEDFCGKDKAGINTLAYLGDVDRAKELLEGQTLYTKAGVYCVDDNNSQNGYREIAVETNTPVTVTNVGVGCREYPVKIIVKDSNGKEFFQNVCISKTNCGMRDDEFIMTKAKYYFPNSFSLVNPNEAKSKSVTAQYVGKTVYLKKKTDMEGPDGNTVNMKRYTTFTLKKLEVVNNTNYFKGTFELNGKEYTKKVTFTNEVVIGDIAGYDEVYFKDMFGLGNIRSKHSKTSDARWEKISEGKVELGMTKEECRLAKGDPTDIVRNDQGREDWIYRDELRKQETMVLCFTKGVLTNVKK